MSSTDLTTGTQFKDVMRERIMAAFMDLIPKEKIDEMVDMEIKAFFDCEQLLTIKNTSVTMDNPKYTPSGGYGHNNQRTITQETLAFGSKMTPFRQMVWSLLHETLHPQLKAILDNESSTVRKEMDKWLVQTAAPSLKDGYTTLFSQMSMGMSAMMLRTAMTEAMQKAHYNMNEALRTVGVNVQNFTPILTPSPEL